MNAPLSLKFLGAAGTVTGSRYLLRTPRQTILVDCGLFQGYKALRLRNRAPFPVPASQIDRVVLTHAHLDHSGYLPLLVKNGYPGRILGTPATRDLCAILLRDSAHLQEREAQLANRYGYTRHAPALPLYTQEDAERAIERFAAVDFHRATPIADGATLTFRRAGHILGAASVEIDVAGTAVVFSGDLGRADSPTMPAPEPIARADYLVVESTYGNRKHDRAHAADAIGAIVERTAKRGGTVLIPTFAVGRAQELLYHLAQLRKRGRISDALPIFLDSPMAVDAARIFHAHPADHRLTPEQCRETCGVATYVRDVRESKALTASRGPKIVLSASGMATGGRVLHHLESLAPDPRNTILFAGFQAGGTRGAAIVGGAESVKIHGQYVPIRAEVANLEMLSAHADADEILAWLRRLERAPRMTFVTHGEPAAADALRVRIQEELGWPCSVPDHLDEFAL